MNEELVCKFFRKLYLIRRVEERIIEIYPTDKIQSPVHLSIGQESVSVGVCEALRKEDVVFGTYRSHALYIAKGGSLKEFFAELYGKKTGCAKGKGGSMHLIAPEVYMFGTSAIVGTTIPHAVGYAYGLKLRKEKSIVVSFFGDGAVEEGVFTESINFAALKKLPVIFVCENNLYSVYTPLHKRQPFNNIYERARVFGIDSIRLDGSDIFSIYYTVKKVVDKIRSEPQPFFIEILTYRWKDHVGVGDDFQLGYRSIAELEPWLKKDPLKHLRSMLNEDEVKKIETEVELEINNAIEFAENSEYPEDLELYTDVYK
ncbi:MAG: thiamine pyrophosphate-dependent dehydrogenase E1 component subunit alpha [bacterium]|nr:thiamine pyrophosphate-dependent dehydrogenase E1 component subunit alpha [bacterium]